MKNNDSTESSNECKPMLAVVIETSYQQKQFIKDKLRPVFSIMNTLKKKENSITTELIRENGLFKNFIGIDCTYKKGSNKSLIITLFWGKFKKMNNEQDYFELLDSCENEHKIELKKDFDYEKNILFIIDFFNEKLSSL
tara:strand:+ start:50 stop:466 length:417 start_codon:yes stop_codon:yes gene_type:complete